MRNQTTNEACRLSWKAAVTVGDVQTDILALAVLAHTALSKNEALLLPINDWQGDFSRRR